MAKISLDGNPCETSGELPKLGTQAPDFSVTKTDLKDVKLSEFKGRKVLLNIFPSIQTGVCSSSARTFNQKLDEIQNVVAICISKDLPFSHHRFCEAERINNLIMASQYKNSSFSDNYKVEIISGPFEGLFSRAVIVIDENSNVIYTEQVPEIGNEPNYEKALDALRK